jgi:hypothetical protein
MFRIVEKAGVVVMAIRTSSSDEGGIQSNVGNQPSDMTVGQMPSDPAISMHIAASILWHLTCRKL